MMLEYFPDYVDTVENCAISSDDGSALVAAWGAGAAKGMFGVHAHNHTLPLTAKIAGVQTVEATDDLGSIGNMPLLWLNREGCRYADETSCYKPTPGGNTVYYGKRVFNVFDQATVDAFIEKGTKIRPWRGKPVDTPLTDLAAQIATGEKIGFVFKADSIETLAEKTGWNPSIATAEIDRYNKIVNSGRDEDCGRSAETLIYTVEIAPFYAVEIHPRCLGSFGGILLTDDYGVLDENGKRIPGFYAAGDVSCGWFGRNYPDFNGLTSYHNTVSGYIAAKSVIDYLT
jgi:fumarate reductase flavoprotein subunit